MKKETFLYLKFFISLLCIHCSYLSVFGQKKETDSISFSILRHREFPLNINDRFKQELSKDLIITPIEIKRPLSLNYPLQYTVPKKGISELNLNIDKISIPSYPVYHLGENTMLYMSRTNDLMPGMADVYNINLGIKMQPTEGWYIDISNSAYKYRDFTGIYNDYTINASSYISLSDNFGINVYGRYSTQAINNTHAGSIPYSPFAPYSYYGGSLEYKITDKFGIEVGMLRQYNTWRRKWENVYFAAPKFYK